MDGCLTIHFPFFFCVNSNVISHLHYLLTMLSYPFCSYFRVNQKFILYENAVP